MKILGNPYTPAQFALYLDTLQFPNWRPTAICIHHCAAPSLAQRPQGFIPQHMLNLKSHYESLGWRSGPHLFIDDDQAWTFTPLNERGVHARSFNSFAIGIEMLGNYDTEDPKSGRGAKVIATTARVVEMLMAKLEIPKSKIVFHRDDPKTSKSCPGSKIDKDWFLSLIKDCL